MISDSGVLVTKLQYPGYSMLCNCVILGVSALDVNSRDLDPDLDIVRNVQNNPNLRLS